MTLTKKELKHFCQLKHKKYRTIYNEFVVEGMRLCKDLLDSPCVAKKIFINPTFGKSQPEKLLLEKAEKKNIPIEKLKPDVMERFCTTKSPPPIAAWGIKQIHNLSSFSQGHRFLVLHSVSDPGNVGTLLRTAEAFNWDGAILTGECPEIYNPKVLRSAMGAVFRFPVYYGNLIDILAFFKKSEVSYMVSSTTKGMVPPISRAPSKLAILLGNEAHGLSDDLTKEAWGTLYIPINNKVDSLNVAIAGGILLYLLKT